MAATAPSHSLFPLPMETAENSPARLPQSVHQKARNNYAYLQVQQMAATAPPHSLFPLPMETAENSPARLPQSVHQKARNKLCISSSATDGSNRAFTFSSRCPWRLLRIHLHGCRNLCTGSKQQLCISSSATDGSNRASTFSSCCPWRLLRIHLHGCRNLCTRKQETTLHIFKCNRWQQPRLHILFSRCPLKLLRIHLHGCRNLCTGMQATTMHIFKCNRWQQPRLHILFPLPIKTAENSPARLPQSVHWKASNNYAYLQVQQMAATAPSHALPVAHGDC